MTILPSKIPAPMVFEQCMGRAAMLSRTMLEQVFQSAINAMRARQPLVVDIAVRMQIGEAADDLSRQRGMLVDRFPALLLAEMGAAVTVAQRGKHKAASPVPLRFDQLELMDDDQVQLKVEIARMQQSAVLQCERELTDLDALVCAAQGFSNVQSDRNPLRPHIYVSAISDVLALTGAPQTRRLLWMQYVGASLGENLRGMYSQLTVFLKSLDVQAASYTVTGSPQSPSQRAPAGPEALRLTVNQLRHVLSGPTGRYTGAGPAHEVELEDVLRDLDQVSALVQQISHQNVAGNSNGSGNARYAKPSAVSTGAKKQQSAKQDGLASEVVRMMIENICDDERLLPAIRNWIGSIDTPLMQLSAVDADFLSDKSHPARMLLDEVTVRSLGFASENSDGFAIFFAPLVAAAKQLLASPIRNALPFEAALTSIQHAWEAQKDTVRADREQAVQALLQAEQRNVLAEKIALELTRRDDVALAPIYIKQFLAGPWAQVVAKARLSRGNSLNDNGGYELVLNDFLWSAVPQIAAKNRPRLARIIPQVLAKLREGLAGIGLPESASTAFFIQLMQSHEQVLKSVPPKRFDEANRQKITSSSAEKSAALPPTAAREALEASFERSEENGTWLAPQEAQDSGFLQEDGDSQTTRPMPYEPNGAQAGAPEHDLLVIEPPDLGSWVEFLSDEKWVRVQLTWASPHGTLFMFTGASGRPYSMTRRALDKMQARGSLHVIAEGSVVVGALDAVAQTALRNSVEIRSRGA